MWTSSELIGRSPALDEQLWRASHNDFVCGRPNLADDVRAILGPYPASGALLGYLFPRLAQDWLMLTKWPQYCALHGIADEEKAFCHIGTYDFAGRRINPADSTNRWVTNIGDPDFKAFCGEMAVQLLKGSYYSATWDGPPEYAQPLEGCIWDVVFWYPNFDDASHENIAATLEYSADPELYQDHCYELFAAVQDHIDSVYPLKWLIPNTSSPFFHSGALPPSYGARANENIAALVAKARFLWVQAYGSYTSNEFVAKANQLVEYWATIQELAAGKMVSGSIQTTPAYEARGGIAAAAWMMMAWAPGMSGRFATDDELTELPLDTVENPEMLKAAHALLGNPAGTFYEVSGSWTKARLFVRRFQYGYAVLVARKDGTTGAEPLPITFSSAVPLQPMQYDTSLGAPTSEVTLTIGEGAILTLAPTTDRLAPVADLSPLEFGLIGSGAHWSAVNESIDSPSTAEYIRCTTYGKRDRLGVGAGNPALPTGVGVVTHITVRVWCQMQDGAPASPSGNMFFPLRLLADGVEIAEDVITVYNNGGWGQHDIGYPVALTPEQLATLEVEVDTTTTGGASEWAAAKPSFQVATINLDVEWTPVDAGYVADGTFRLPIAGEDDFRLRVRATETPRVDVADESDYQTTIESTTAFSTTVEEVTGLE